MELTLLDVDAGTSLSANARHRYSRESLHPASTPFPQLSLGTPEQRAWPAPPIVWQHLPPPADNVVQACSIELVSSKTVRGEMCNFDPEAGHLTFASSSDGMSVSLAFTSFRRLTLTTPLRADPRSLNAGVTRLPTARQEREYTLHGAAFISPMSGRTTGYIEAAAGLYLFAPVEDEAALQRVFVPRWAYSKSEFGASAEEIAATMWISNPAALLEALERQEHLPVLPIGRSLLALGLLTQAQLDRELAKPAGDIPLGESLVAAGLISSADLQTAIAHKMGYPMVDLNRFPIDPMALAKVPRAVAARHRMLPLMIDQGRLIVAVDRPSRLTELRSLHMVLQMPLVPALASATQIAVTLDRLLPDLWSQQVVGRPSFIQSTAT